MLKIYCSECGSPTEYSLNKPKFCVNCGNSFFGTKKEEKVVKKVLLQKPTITAKSQNIESLDIDDEFDIKEINHVPDITELNFDIQIQPDTSEKIGNIIGTSSEKENLLRSSRGKIKINRKEQLENFKKEAGAIRPKSRVKNNKK